MDEKTLVSALRKTFLEKLPGVVVFKHADGFTSGVPDTSITWRVQTTWIEVKYVRTGQKLKSTELQRLTCRRLGDSCLFVIYVDGPAGKKDRRTYIVKANELEDYESTTFHPGYDHTAVVREVARRHGGEIVV